MSILSGVEPKSVFKYFEEISSIPRPSYQEKAISDHLVKFAKDRDLEVHQDSIYNVIIIKEASEGYEDVPPIIIQGHMDMVCEKVAGCPKDMEKEGLDLVLDGDTLSAEGTTLGGDDGIAVAFAMALLDDDTLKHPRLEVVITVSEEVGMDGARDIDLSGLRGKRLLNLDSEGEGTILASCAGGGRADVVLPLRRERVRGDVRMLLSVTGLKGGHSGDEIDKGRANATILLNRALMTLRRETDMRLIALEGGSKDNAIPRESYALISVPKKMADSIPDLISSLSDAIHAEYHLADPDISLSCQVISDAKKARELDLPEEAVGWHPLTKRESHRVITLIAALPNGIQRMSDAIPGLVETSLNLGVCYMTQKELGLGYSLRSSVGAAYSWLHDQLQLVASGLGASVSFHGEYPAWEFVDKSDFRDRICEIYKSMFGQELRVEAIHAGLECGLLSAKVDGLDAVSMGPDIWDIHTPDEHLSVASVERTWRFVRAIIEDK